MTRQTSPYKNISRKRHGLEYVRVRRVKFGGVNLRISDDVDVFDSSFVVNEMR